MPIVSSISGLRATLNDSLTPDLIIDYCYALNSILDDGFIVVGSDGRPSGSFIKHLLLGTFNALGREIWDLGICPTPTVQIFAEKTDAIAGIAITASHNPSNWNGLKFINSNGIFFNKRENELLWGALNNSNKIYSFNENIAVKEIKDSIDKHIDIILSSRYFDDSLYYKIKKRNIKAVVDAVNGSGSIIIPKLLRKLGVEVIKLYCDGSGKFPHTPEPLPENLNDLSKAVVASNADIGIAIDPDGDRLVLIDENGKPIGEEKTIGLSVLSILMNNENNDIKVVVNLSTSRIIDDICKEYNATLFRSPVGEINVVNKMKEVEAIIGGEGSGGVILPEIHYGRDSLSGIILLINLMVKSGLSLSQLSKKFKDYVILKMKFEFNEDLNLLVEKLIEEFKDFHYNLEDGIRFDNENSWVQIRKSNTEPIIRIISEALDNKEAELLANRVKKYLKN